MTIQGVSILTLLCCWGTSLIGQALPSGPSLDQTVTFMDAMLEVDGDSFAQPAACIAVAFQSSGYVFGIPERYGVLDTDAKGVQHYGFSWHMYGRKPAVMQFALGDIDPTTIVSSGVASSDFIRAHHMGESPTDLDNPDLTFVRFSTSNAKQTVKHADVPSHIKGEKTLVENYTFSTGDMIVFRSRDRAERFVTAFKHAVALCGGRASEFPPTAGTR